MKQEKAELEQTNSKPQDSKSNATKAMGSVWEELRRKTIETKNIRQKLNESERRHANLQLDMADLKEENDRLKAIGVNYARIFKNAAEGMENEMNPTQEQTSEREQEYVEPEVPKVEEHVQIKDENSKH